MGNSGVISKEKKNKKDRLTVWAMQITSSINTIIGLFSSTFLVSNIVHVNSSSPLGQTLVSIALYYVSLYAVMMVVYFLMGYLVDRTNRVWLYRLGILIKGTFIILVVFLGQDLARLSALAGAIYGLAESCYWSSYNVMKCELVPRKYADNFIAINTILSKVVNIIFPILIGFMIDVSTYGSVAIYVLCIVAIQLICSFMITSYRPQNSSFDFFKYLKKLKGNTEDIKRIKNFYPIALGYGGTTICTTIVTILSVYTFKTNLNLGLFTAGFAIMSVLVMLIIKKTTKMGHRKALFLIMGILPLVSAIFIAFNITKWTYIVYNMCETISLCVLAYALDIQRTIILKKTGHYEDIAEHQTVTEIIFSFARITTYAIMLVLGLLLDVIGLKITVVIVTLSLPILSVFLVKMENVERNYAEENVQPISVENVSDLNVALANVENIQEESKNN